MNFCHFFLDEKVTKKSRLLKNCLFFKLRFFRACRSCHCAHADSLLYARFRTNFSREINFTILP